MPKLLLTLNTVSTGLSYTQDKLIELGMVKFEYNRHGSIFRLLGDFSGYQDPGIPITEYITELTGINDDMVKGQKIQENAVANYLQDVDLIIAHNAQFDRTFLETTFPSLPAKAWGCLMYDVDWDKERISSRKLEYIAYKLGFFHEGHRAINDCLAGVHLLAQKLPKSQVPVLKELLTQSAALRFKLYAVNSPYDSKELLKGRGYRWSMNQNDKYRAWSIELIEDKVAEEINYLRSSIYSTSSINIPVEIFDTYSRFSSTNNKSNNHVKYRDKLEWFQKLCTS